MFANAKITRQFKVPAYIRVGEWAATAVMFLGALGFLVSAFPK